MSLGEEEDWLVSHIAKIEKLPLKFVIHGSNYDYPFLARVRRHLRDVLIAKGYDIQYYEYLGGHMYMGFAMNHSFSQGLIYLLNNK